ncbi:hypothetical protein D3C85_1704570 [compost metagenome]
MDGTVTAQVIEYVMGAMFVVLPMVFISAMGWAGYSVGANIEGMLSRGSNGAQISASKGASQLLTAAKRTK